MFAVDRREFLSQCAAATASLSALAVATPTRAEESPARSRIKIGQIGVGHAHANKIDVYRASSDYEIVGVVEDDPQLRKQAEAQPRYRGLTWMSRDQLLATPGLQAVLVETHVRDLLANAEACIAAGKHIHLDKPAGASLPHLKRVLDAASRQKLIVQMGYMFRYNPAVVLLRDALKQGWIGDVFEVHTSMSKIVPPAQRRELAEFSGGILFELGCHVIDLVVGILGKPDEVQAFPRKSGKFDDGLMDNGLAVFSYPKATASVRSSAIEVDGGDRRHLVVCGTEGTFHIQPLDNPSARVTFTKPHGEYKAGYQTVTFPKYQRYVDDAADMARVIRGEKEFAFSPAHDLAVQETLLRACAMPVDR